MASLLKSWSLCRKWWEEKEFEKVQPKELANRGDY